MTITLRVDPLHPDPAALHQAADCLRSGGLVAFPTETVYGLGAHALNAQAVARIFAAKGRPSSDPLIVHLADWHALELVCASIPDGVALLAKRFWPGPLTLVLPRHVRVPPEVTGGGPTVAVRVPSHPVALGLLHAAALPIAAPSANRFARPSPTTAQHVLADLDGQIDLLLDGGATPIGVESTVLDLTAATPTILRPGGVSFEALHALLPDVHVSPRYLNAETAHEPMAAPGQSLRHYAPDAAMTLFLGDARAVLHHILADVRQHLAAGRRVGVLVADEDRVRFADLPILIATPGPAHDPQRVAAGLFEALRTFDGAGLDVILARGFGVQGLGLAVQDRLIRAAEGRVVYCHEDELGEPINDELPETPLRQ